MCVQTNQELEEVLESFSVMAPSTIFYNCISNPTDYQIQQVVATIEKLTQKYQCRNLVVASSEVPNWSIASCKFPLLSPFLDNLVILSRNPKTRTEINQATSDLTLGFEITVVRTLKEALELLR